MVIYGQQLENKAAASSHCDQKEGLSEQNSSGSGRDPRPLRVDHQEASEDGRRRAHPRMGQEDVTGSPQLVGMDPAWSRA